MGVLPPADDSAGADPIGAAAAAAVMPGATPAAGMMPPGPMPGMGPQLPPAPDLAVLQQLAPDIEERIEWEDLEQDLDLHLSDDDAQALIADALNAITAAVDGRRERMETIEKVRERYYLTTPERDPPADWMANWHVPFMRWVLDGVNSRLWSNAVGSGEENWVLVSGVRGLPDVDRAARIEPFLQYVNRSELHLDRLYDEVIERVGTDGVVMLKGTWRRQVQRVRRRRLIEETEEAIDLETQLPLLDAFNRPKVRRIRRYVVDEEEEEVYHGPRAELVTIDNFVVPNPHESTVEGQPWVAHQFYLTRDQLWMERERRTTLNGVEQQIGLYQNVDKIVSVTRREETSAHGLEARTGAEQGVSTQQTSPDLVGQVRCWELIWPYRAWRMARDRDLTDAAAEKLPARALITIAADNRVLLRAKRYEFWDPEPETLWVKVAVIPREGWFYNQAPGEILMPVQDEIDTIHWQRSDATTVMIMAFLTFIAEEGAADQLKQLTLGTKNVVNQLDGVKLLADFIRIAIQVPGMDVETLLLRFGELLSGIGDPQLGQIGRSGTTAFEVGSVLREGNLKFAKMIARLGDSIVAMDQIVLRRYAQFYPLVAPKIFRIKGAERDVVEELALGDLNFDYDLKLRGASVAVNKELEAAKAFRVLQLSEQSTWLNALLLSYPPGVYELVSTVMQQIEWPGGVEVLIGKKADVLPRLSQILTILAATRGVPGPNGAAPGGGPDTTQRSPIAAMLNAAGLTPELANLGGASASPAPPSHLGGVPAPTE